MKGFVFALALASLLPTGSAFAQGGVIDQDIVCENPQLQECDPGYDMVNGDTYKFTLKCPTGYTVTQATCNPTYPIQCTAQGSDWCQCYNGGSSYSQMDFRITCKAN